MSGGFGGAASRIITQLVNRVVTEKLANNKTFQQAAVKTAQQVHKAKQAAAETKTSSSKMSFKNTSLYKSFDKVKTGLKKEIQEELAKANKRWESAMGVGWDNGTGINQRHTIIDQHGRNRPVPKTNRSMFI